MKKFITTPIYYVNDKPHIGHAYTTTIADIIARWFRIKGYDVFFLTGTDEHGAKIEKAATEKGIEPKQFVDQVSQQFKDAWKVLNISYDRFIRTTDPDHEATVKYILQKLYDKGDIYKGEYEGWYCLPDESYFSDEEIVDGKCPVCGRPVQKIKEEAYFFRLSKYEKEIREFLEGDHIIPASRANEQINRIAKGIRDLDISRKNVKWGIPLPFDPTHTTYVWFDALLNYISALGYPSKIYEVYPNSEGTADVIIKAVNEGKFEKFWPPDVQLIGKEIAWFHSVIWIGILSAIGLQPPQKLLANGWWTVNGKKMSKSLGNVVDPVELANKYGADAVRYALIREKPVYDDGDFSEEKLKARINGELVDELGNLVNRVLSLAERNNKQFNGTAELDKVLNLAKIDEAMENYDLFNALEEIMQFVRYCNKYINEKQVWALKGEDLDNALFNLLNSIKAIGIFIYPFMPSTGEKIMEMLGFSPQDIKLENVKFDKIGPIKYRKILFNKY
jgi:methionyl-tRNA synthetase